MINGELIVDNFAVEEEQAPGSKWQRGIPWTSRSIISGSD